MNYSQSKLSVISNIIFLSFSIFLITFIWVKFYTRNLSLSLFLGFIFAIIFTIFYILFIKQKQTNDYNKSLTKNNEENFKNHLILSDYKTLSILIFNLFNITTKNEISPNHHITNNSDIFLFFENNLLDNNNFINLIKLRNFKNIEIYCINHTVDIEIENIDIIFITLDKIIERAKSRNYNLSNPTKIKQKQKLTIIQILKAIFNKSRSKKYLIFGFFLIFTSLFTPFTFYYSIVGTILILFSIYSRFNSKFNS